MKVRDGMTRLVLTIGPAHTLREAARLMSARRVGAAVVVDSEHSGVGILTERDILDSVGAAASDSPNHFARGDVRPVVRFVSWSSLPHPSWSKTTKAYE